MSIDFASSAKVVALKIFILNKKDNLTKLSDDELSKLQAGYRNDESNEYIYYVHRDRGEKTKWFINRQDFHLMKLIARLENNIKETEEQLIASKSAFNKVNLNDVCALQMNQIFWIKRGNESQNLIESYLKEKLKTDRDLEKKLSDLIENNIKVLVTLKDLMQSRIQPNFEHTIIRIKIEESLTHE